MIIDHFCREKERDKERRSMDRMGEDGSKRDIRKKDILLYNTFRTFLNLNCFYRMSNIIFIRSVY